MIKALTKQLFSIALSFLLAFTALSSETGAQAAPTGSPGYSSQTAPLSPDELTKVTPAWPLGVRKELS